VPNWNQLLDEIVHASSTHNLLRRKYLAELHALTRRNVILYYSGWLQKPHLLTQGSFGFQLNDADKNGFMAAIHGLDKSIGVDLILHTPGGEIAATESLVDYLHSIFGGDIRAFVPQLAMSAGTMIALSCKEIVMGKHSSLGPIDPQIFGLAAHGILEEFNKAADEIKTDQSRILVWQPIIAKYSPTLIGECQKAIQWANEIVKKWLEVGMFRGQPAAAQKAQKVVDELGSHELTKSHARHISLARAKELGLVVKALEDDSRLQEAVLTVHHACVHTLADTPAVKIIENHNGTGYIPSATA
jgi:ClpP class serine protease